MPPEEKASIALDAAMKMCETPFWNFGEHYDEPQDLEKVDFNTDLDDDVREKSKETLILSLCHEKSYPWHGLWLNLELMYHVALEGKKMRALNGASKTMLASSKNSN